MSQIGTEMRRADGIGPGAFPGGSAGIAFAFVLLLAGIIGLQCAVSAYSGEFMSDANSHYVSGSMIHDFLLGGPFRNPVGFLVDFHSHYPLVDIGHWPPLYYVIEAGWMLPFSASRTSMLVLSATVTALTALLLYWDLGRRIGLLAGLFAAIAFITAPLVEAASSTLMLDVPVALFCVAAMLAFARFMESGRARYSTAFGLFAVAALLVKGNAGCLALLPPVAILLGRRFDLLRVPAFWIPVPIVAVLAAPWYALTHARTEAGFRYAAGWNYISSAAVANSVFLLHTVGPLILALALIGLVRLCLSARGADALAVSAAGLLVGVVLFLLLIPAAITDRYMIPALPPVLILAAFAASWLAGRFLAGTASRRRRNEIVAFIILIVSAVPQALELPSLEVDHDGMTEAARQIWLARIPANASVLIATDPLAEGQAVADLAMRDPQRPSLFAVRGSRLLGGGGYNNSEYQPRFTTPAEVMAEIDRYSIPLILVRKRGDGSDWEHVAQLEAARESDPSRWELIYRDDRHGPEIQLFRLRDNVDKPADAAALKALSTPNALR
jgi:hypothetical protein